MAESTGALSTNGPNSDLESFEQDISDILRDDTPDLGDMSSAVQGGSNTEIDIGTSASQLPGSFYGNEAQGQQSQGGSGQIAKSRLTRSHTVPIATSNVSLSSSQSNGDFVPKSHIQNAQSRLESLKDWSLNTYKCTKQYLSERLGKGSRTVDAELQSKIDNLRETQKKYQTILRLTRAMSSHFYHVVQTQRLLGETFSDLSQKAPELQDEFTYNCETQRTLVRNGETLLGALNFFTSSVNTLVNKTMEDTVITIRQYENARLEFDAYRNDLDTLQLAPKDVTNYAFRLDDARQRYDEHKVKFDQLRQDVAIKLKFLDENKVKVMHKQLLLFHNAVSGYFSGNQIGLEATLKQFSISLNAPNSEAPSWLEQ